MAGFKAKFPVLQELFAKNHRGALCPPPPSGARVNCVLIIVLTCPLSDSQEDIGDEFGAPVIPDRAIRIIDNPQHSYQGMSAPPLQPYTYRVGRNKYTEIIVSYALTARAKFTFFLHKGNT